MKEAKTKFNIKREKRGKEKKEKEKGSLIIDFIINVYEEKYKIPISEWHQLK